MFLTRKIGFVPRRATIALSLSITFASASAVADGAGISALLQSLRVARTAVAEAHLPKAGGAYTLSQENRDALGSLADLQAFTGDSPGAVSTVDQINGGAGVLRAPTPEEVRQINNAQAKDAIDSIVSAARGKRAVLINEAHTAPMHRAFTQKLLIALKKVGFTYLACEAFSDGPLSELKYVTLLNGYYTREPVFAGMVNAALSNGFKLVAYDFDKEDEKLDPLERMQRRERLQAQRIFDQIFAKDKYAKVLIHVGHHHLGKVPVGPFTPMGVHLRRLLGANATLHIDQTLFYARSSPGNEHPLYRAVLNRFPSLSPFILQTKAGGNLPLNGAADFVDMTVFFPIYGERHGRPEWLQRLADRRPRDIPRELIPETGERLILAYDQNHKDDAAPSDVVLLRAGQPVPKLMLPKGNFRFEVQE